MAEETSILENLKKEFYNYVKGVVITEKYSRMIEFENKLVFRVIKDANKTLLKVIFENYFNQKIKKINIVNDHNNIKKAIVTFEKEGVASEIASDFGIM